ncbi:MAG: sulfatase-like hydrolase/transferase [Pirellulaceae bacterium]
MALGTGGIPAARLRSRARPARDAVTPDELNRLFEARVESASGIRSSGGTDADDSRLIAREAIDFMQRSVTDGEPFFVVIWFHSPHMPLVDPEAITPENSADALKDGIENLDSAVGMVRQTLRELGVRDNTMVWFTSDNGPENRVDTPDEANPNRSFRTGRLRGRKRSLFEGGIRVPGLLEWPAVVSAPSTTSVPCVTSDYYPTIVDYLGLDLPAQKPLDGVSLRPLIEGRVDRRERPIGFEFAGRAAWVDNEFKLVRDGRNAPWELFHISADSEPALLEAPERALATSENVDRQPEEWRARFAEMLRDFENWEQAIQPSRDEPGPR